MAEPLDDGEFWLPSQFLTDDDDFSTSDLGSFSTETESSDFNDLLDFHVLSTSPQSTLLGYGGECSPTVPVKESGGNINGASNLKFGSAPRSYNNTGTGFFDCSNIASKARLSRAPPQPNTTHRGLPSVYSPPLLLPHMTMGIGQLSTPQQQRLQQNRVPKKNSNNRPLGIPPTAWPPLSGQTHPMLGMVIGPNRESAGTGVFLPRRIASPAQPKKKSDGHARKTKSIKGPNRQKFHPDNNNKDEIKLPSEWIY